LISIQKRLTASNQTLNSYKSNVAKSHKRRSRLLQAFANVAKSFAAGEKSCFQYRKWVFAEIKVISGFQNHLVLVATLSNTYKKLKTKTQ